MARTSSNGSGHVWPELLEFVLPGVVHGLGNAVFTIRGHAQLLGGAGGEIGRDRAAIVKAGEKADQVLSILRWLADDGDSHEPRAQAGIALHRLVENLRVPLRDRGVTIAFQHGSKSTPALVEGATLCRATVEAVRQLVEVLPSGFAGRLVVDLARQSRAEVVVSFSVVAMRSALPFPIDVGAAAERGAPVWSALAVDAELSSDGRGLRLRIPACG